MRRSSYISPTRRRSPMLTLAVVLLVLLLGFLVYLWTIDTEVPAGRIEQDVTNELLAG